MCDLAQMERSVISYFHTLLPITHIAIIINSIWPHQLPTASFCPVFTLSGIAFHTKSLGRRGIFNKIINRIIRGVLLPNITEVPERKEINSKKKWEQGKK